MNPSLNDIRTFFSFLFGLSLGFYARNNNHWYVVVALVFLFLRMAMGDRE